MPDGYVVLTSAKGNAGDHLIKHRVSQLLATFRPDRSVVHYDAWKPLNADQLAIVNSSRALILAGGPALQYRMYPGVYPLVSDLDQIKIPVILMGVGWKSLEGTWAATHDYPLTPETLRLLSKIDASGSLSSVRDYHTLNVLFTRGFKNVMVTGCPALYALDEMPVPLADPADIRKVSISLGVQFVADKAAEAAMKEVLLRLADFFPEQGLQAVFHHSPSMPLPTNAGPDSRRFVEKHKEMAVWLLKAGICWVDLAADLNNLLVHYRDCDLHVGYRVHAHILMSSWFKPSVLVAEDGRGTGLRGVIGGLILDGYSYRRPNQTLVARLLRKLKIDGRVAYRANSGLAADLVSGLRYELSEKYPRVSHSRGAIETHLEQMKVFLGRLP
jgi:hypothetical protein